MRGGISGELVRGQRMATNSGLVAMDCCSGEKRVGQAGRVVGGVCVKEGSEGRTRRRGRERDGGMWSAGTERCCAVVTKGGD